MRTKITKQHPNFRFRHANIHNKEYNEKGDIDASSFVFPYPENEFDFVLATSVFTHMLPDAALHYLMEVRRVLRPGGRCMISFFFLDAESKKHLPSSPFPFKQVDERYSVMNEDNPEAAIAFEEAFVRKAYARAGLAIAPPIHYGTWSGRRAPAAGQDIIVANKPH